MQQYGDFSKLYDELMYDCDYVKWSQYLLCEIKANRGEIIRGADLACGSGNMTLLLKKGGVDVFGVDISEEMLREGMRKAREEGLKINFILADAVDFSAPKKLDFVSMCLDGVNYIDKKRILPLFQNVYNNLKEGGVFLFDISSEYKLIDYIGENVFYDDGEKVTYLWTNKVNEDRVTYNLAFFVQEKDGRYVRFDESHTLTAYSVRFIKEMLTKAGLKDIKILSEDFTEKVKKDNMRVHFSCFR